MILTTTEVVKLYKVTRPTLLKWEKLDKFKGVCIHLPESSHKRYVKEKLDVFLGITDGDVEG